MGSIRHAYVGVLVALIGSLLVPLHAPAAYAVDRDCSDFASQRAAQIFFLSNGGPRRDPHRLDADGDGIACEDNPSPYYTKKVLPAPKPPPVVNSAVRFTVSPNKAIAGESLTMKVQVRPELQRTVVLQRRTTATGWKRVHSARTSRRGTLTHQAVAQPRTSRYRAVVPAARNGARRYSSAVSEVERVVTQQQAVALSMPRAALVGKPVVAFAEVSPVRRHREVLLQRRRALGGWAHVDRGVESRRGHVRFELRAERRGRYTFRAVVSPEDGAAAARSNKERLRVTRPPAQDTTPPPVPTGLTASAGDGLVALTWNPVSARDLASYAVYQKPAGGSWTLVALAAGESHEVRGLVNGTAYAFAVSAVDTSDNESAMSTAVPATPVAPDRTPPPVPAGVTATGGDAQVTVGWDQVTSPDLAGYTLYQREAPNGFWVVSTDLAAAVTSARVIGLANGTTYEFAVTTSDRSGNESVMSAAVTATPLAPPPPPPPAPTDLVATAGDGQVSLDWAAVTDPAVVGYRVYLRTSPDGAWTLAPEGLTASTETVVSGLINGVEHSFVVSALTEDGIESDTSNVVSATPVAAAAP